MNNSTIYSISNNIKLSTTKQKILKKKKYKKYWKIYPIHVHPYYIFFISRYSGIYVIASYRWAKIGFNINRKCTIKDKLLDQIFKVYNMVMLMHKRQR